MFVWTISSEPKNILSPNLVWWCSITSQSVLQKNWFTVFNVKVTVRAFMIKIWLFLLYLLNCCYFATRLGLLVQHHKLECPVRKWDYCIQGQGHSKGLNCVCDCVCSVSPDPLNHFLPNLVWCCIIMRRCVMQKNWFTIFSVKATARAYVIRMWLFLCIFYF